MLIVLHRPRLKNIFRRPSINENELIHFIGHMTELDDETIVKVLNSELLFLKMKGVVK